MQRKQIKNYISSPLNYIGGKARILDQILPHMPSDIDIFVDLFCGGCNVGMNVSADYTIYNDISKPLISLLKAFKRMNNETIINRINALINEFGLSKTRNHNFKFYGGDANKGVSAYNREKFLLLRERFNSHPKKDNQYYILLYTLILFGFNNQLRFNDKGEFNLPVGKRDFNTAIEAKLVKFLDALRMQPHEFQTKDFRKFNFADLTENSLVYCDPPYLITTATYNEKDGWTEQDERDLFAILDKLTEKRIRFVLSNVLHHEGKENSLLIEWIGQHNYRVHNLFMDYHYSNYQKKSKKAESQEVLITNY
ncbi:MAG: Dam family site-specific DNA-(adenine-N6)-methyltransferase [Bacteroidales bacterium]|nr:Dam family site-specific DNA-(adenine-N6)-methyltransferase [Bacteroidales bacterium]